ncbi:MAG: DUF421 domain-containing protein [Clostridia bacterium]|nr:DUF421 domain-containing protein [Clostridia bacterium]
MFVSLIRTVILYAVVIFAVRVMGKRQIKEMQASEIVVTLMISNIAAMPMQEVGISIFTGIVPILTLVITEMAMSYIMLKSRSFRQLISGMPVVVIEKGEVNQAAMRSLRLSNEDLFEELRKKDIFDPGAVEYAIIETDGVLSVLLKGGELPLTVSQAGKEVGEGGSLNALIVSDGEIEKEAAKVVGWTPQKIKKTLRSQSTDLSDVFIMYGDSAGKFRIIKKAP